MRTNKIAIIDDGVDINFIDKNINIHHYEIKNKSIIKIKKYKSVSLTHGTICALILDFYSKNCINIYSIKILNPKTLKCNIESLVIALEWCYNNSIDIINLSLGSQYEQDKLILQNAINKLTSKNIIIVAAYNNKNTMTYPATFEKVIGVKVDKKNTIENYIFKEENNNYIDIIVSTYKLVIESEVLSHMKLSESNSYATPYVTALISNYISNNNISFCDLKKYLFDNSD